MPTDTRTGDARYTYELDALDRVRRVRDRATNAIVAELRYDALSRVAAGATDGQEFERWFAGSTRIHEVSGSGPELRASTRLILCGLRPSVLSTRQVLPTYIRTKAGRRSASPTRPARCWNAIGTTSSAQAQHLPPTG